MKNRTFVEKLLNNIHARRRRIRQRQGKRIDNERAILYHIRAIRKVDPGNKIEGRIRLSQKEIQDVYNALPEGPTKDKFRDYAIIEATLKG